MPSDKLNPICKTDAQSRTLGQKLIDEAKFASIGVLEPATHAPIVSRVGVVADQDGCVVFLASRLSGHAKALNMDERASIMVGEPGKGDPLAHPRITLIGKVEKIERDSQSYWRLRTLYLARHPKSSLYVDFSDFDFFRMKMERANLNGGFGKAYELTPDDLKRQL